MSTQRERPHIILIMTDQQRVDTIGAWESAHMTTPHMDRLAAEGLSFRRAYCPGATCMASRAAIFTGMYPHNTGVYAFDAWSHHRNWVEDLSDAGYWCVNIGKMHLGPIRAEGGFHERIIVENPNNGSLFNGGDDDDWGRFLTLNGAARPYDRHRTDPQWREKLQGAVWELEERLHSDVYIGDMAASWIGAHCGDRPLFLQVGFTGPHEPWDPLPRHLDLYDERPIPSPRCMEGELETKPPQHAAHKERLRAALDSHESGIDLYAASEADIERMRRHYYAKVTTVDEQVGKVLAALEDKGYLENSLLVFCSDHGELLGDHAQAYKWLMYEEVTNIPLIVRDSRKPESGGQQTRDLVSLMDVGPTLLEAAGIEVPSYMEGRSLRPYIEGLDDQFTPRVRVFCEDNYEIMMREDRFKMVYYIGQEAGELYDMETDPHEFDNLWDRTEYAQCKETMLRQLLSWLATSTYYNAGYKRGRTRRYSMCWPQGKDSYLTGASAVERPVDL